MTVEHSQLGVVASVRTEAGLILLRDAARTAAIAAVKTPVVQPAVLTRHEGRSCRCPVLCLNWVLHNLKVHGDGIVAPVVTAYYRNRVLVKDPTISIPRVLTVISNKVARTSREKTDPEK